MYRLAEEQGIVFRTGSPLSAHLFSEGISKNLFGNNQLRILAIACCIRISCFFI